MSFIKKAGLGISAFMLTVMLYALVSIVTFLLTMGNANYIKNTLQETGFYNNIVQGTINLTVSQGSVNSENQNSINDLKILTPLLQQTISPQVIQNTIEPIIDGFNSWLQGKSNQPQFSIDTNTVNTQLISQIANYLSDQTDKLPVCANASQLQLPFNPLTATCRPATPINPDDFTNAASNFADSMPIFNGKVVTMQVIDPQGNLQNNTLIQKIPTFYQWLNIAQFVCGVLIIVFASLIIWLKPRKYMALKTIGRTFIIAAIFLLVSGLLFLFYFGNNGVPLISSSTSGQQAFMQSIINPLAQHLTKTLGNYYLYFAAIYAFIGIVLFLIGKKYQPTKINTISPEKPITVEPYKSIESFHDHDNSSYIPPKNETTNEIKPS